MLLFARTDTLFAETLGFPLGFPLGFSLLFEVLIDLALLSFEDLVAFLGDFLLLVEFFFLE